MKRTWKKIVLAGSFCLAVVAAQATDGYFGVGYGTINKGLAGAGVAYYQGSLINGNPAGAVWLGKKYQLGIELFNPNRQFTVTGTPTGDPYFGLMPGTVKSESKVFFMPTLGANWMLGEKSALSVSIFGNGGMNTDYPTAVFYDSESESTGVNLAQLFADVTYSLKIAENHSVGVTGVLAYQYFEAKGLKTFGDYGFSSDPANLTNNGNSGSTGVGVKVGYMGQLFDGFTVGAMYQSKVYMSEFDEYAGLFAEQGDFDIPASWTAGFAWDVTDAFTVMADVKQIFYSGVKSIANPMMPNIGMAMMGDAGYLLGADNGPGFGWKDVTVVKLGVSCSAVEKWTFRAGYSIGENPVPESEVMFNILAPGVITNQLGFGLTRDMGEKGSQLHFALNYALNNDVTGSNPMDPGQTIKLEMNQLEIEFGISF
ncbi:OmpP1/FadL family transporter [Mangrovibacterium diazotrophicum]|uniref:Long-chain fatty acid transport protein n=1 Tax=Mangrovibacterium diazotrophicum TaxID=1261403 RepID=A0A419WAI8_9BACT|nr:outer membrane protein transport protein [Mangrovibacterium diazotrophicum]RKD92459.1 long-chain fatty acid transport protein [Mangrovibacterium diazotrophicum]